MDDLIEFYDAYGESLARRVAVIGHTDERKAFVKVATLEEPVEVLKLLKNGLKADTRVLIWEQFTEDIDDSGRDNYHSVLTGSVSVIRKAGQDIPTQRKAVQTSRQAVLKVIALMLQDSIFGELSRQIISYRVVRQSGQEIAGLGDGWCGYGFQFSWTVPLDLTLEPGDLVPQPD